MKSQKKIIIFGTGHSGKSTLIKLFDNHPNINVIHTHDCLINPFYKNSKIFWNNLEKKNLKYYNLEKKNKKHFKKTYIRVFGKSYILNLPILRKILENTGYRKTEYLNKIGYFWDDSGKKSKGLKFKFNFEKFDQLNIKDIFNSNFLNPEKLIDIISINYLKCWKNIQYKNKSYICYMAPNNIKCLEYMFKNNFNFRAIYINRMYHTKIVRKFSFLLHLRDLLTLNILKKKYQRRLLVIDFNDLILNHEKEIIKICKFFRIKKNKNIFKISFSGILEKNNYLGKINTYKKQNAIDFFYRVIEEKFL